MSNLLGLLSYFSLRNGPGKGWMGTMASQRKFVGGCLPCPIAIRTRGLVNTLLEPRVVDLFCAALFSFVYVFFSMI